MSKCPQCGNRISFKRFLFTPYWNHFPCHSCGSVLELSRNQAYLFGIPFLIVILGIRFVPWFGFGVDLRGSLLWVLYVTGGVMAYGMSSWLASRFAIFRIQTDSDQTDELPLVCSCLRVSTKQKVGSVDSVAAFCSHTKARRH